MSWTILVVIPISFNWPLTAIRLPENKIILLPLQKSQKYVMDKKSTTSITAHKKARLRVKIHFFAPEVSVYQNRHPP